MIPTAVHVSALFAVEGELLPALTHLEGALAAKSSDGRDVRLYLHQHRAPYSNYGLNGLPLDLTDEWQVFVVQFTTTGFTTPVDDGRFRIWLAGSDAANANYYFDDVVMTPLDAFDTMLLMGLEEEAAVAKTLIKVCKHEMSQITVSQHNFIWYSNAEAPPQNPHTVPLPVLCILYTSCHPWLQNLLEIWSY